MLINSTNYIYKDSYVTIETYTKSVFVLQVATKLYLKNVSNRLNFLLLFDSIPIAVGIQVHILKTMIKNTKSTKLLSCSFFEVGKDAYYLNMV